MIEKSEKTNKKGKERETGRVRYKKDKKARIEQKKRRGGREEM